MAQTTSSASRAVQSEPSPSSASARGRAIDSVRGCSAGRSGGVKRLTAWWWTRRPPSSSDQQRVKIVERSHRRQSSAAQKAAWEVRVVTARSRLHSELGASTYLRRRRRFHLAVPASTYLIIVPPSCVPGRVPISLQIAALRVPVEIIPFLKSARLRSVSALTAPSPETTTPDSKHDRQRCGHG